MHSLKSILFIIIVVLFANCTIESTHLQSDAQHIRDTFEPQLYTLPAEIVGHYGLRMYRQSLNEKYAAAIWSDMARVASVLNQFADEVYTPEQIQAYSGTLSKQASRIKKERAMLRYEATKRMPEYFYFYPLLDAMERVNEYGLKHREDAKLREILRRYDFRRYTTDPEMIRAWAAQLANQVYTLRILGEQDVVADFIEVFRATYPDDQDARLSTQQFANKVYGLTHILFAASEYYQYPIQEQEYQWIYDYLRHNIERILTDTKEDVIAEVGISFLLAGLESDPVVFKTRQAIQKAINPQLGLIPSVRGERDLIKGEHRNVLAIMLLDWQGVHAVPKIKEQPKLFHAMPYGLVAK